MADELNVVGAAYQKIAVNLARDIAFGKYAPGTRISGRSTLSAQYGVSPETIRKAVFILKDVGILATEKGSGIEVLSREKAAEFVSLYQKALSANELRKNISNWADAQQKEMQTIKKTIQQLLDVTERYTTLNPILPFEITVPEGSPVIDQTVTELHFWQLTGGTIAAIKRDSELILSPGPYASFREKDIFYIIGDEKVQLRVQKLLLGE